MEVPSKITMSLQAEHTFPIGDLNGPARSYRNLESYWRYCDTAAASRHSTMLNLKRSVPQRQVVAPSITHCSLTLRIENDFAVTTSRLRERS